MKRVIVEGMDSAGKTTAIRRLVNELHVLTGPIVNSLGPKQDFDSWWPQMLEWDHGRLIPIHDRFFYSEIVYGEVLRGFVKASGPVVRRIERSLREESLLIYCRPSLDAMERTFGNKEQMAGVTGKFYKLIKTYDQLMTQEAQFYGQRFLRYNWEVDDPRWLVTRVEEYLNRPLEVSALQAEMEKASSDGSGREHTR